MVNVSKLKGKIVEKNMSVEEVAKRVNIDRATFYRKLAQNGESFSIREADAIVKALDLDGLEASAIFFSQFVA